ncbi:putative RNA 2'-phosphotransferase [Halogeometricum rufum]|uniref:Probable RNA 2'-phosphotransferase n=1 Tax=Halogeometricum rufum TaxID=553469 RepID=A0A1I6ISQ4_9EURY|nr:RNA 2'-phosphotransferase [Halogeometricum rufum]SFR69768.1 putative RNA 2'-phosphotransferase [Halogeometricum rufum]
MTDVRVQLQRVIRRCPDHGHFDEATCPDCDDEGDAVLEANRRVRLSKFVSGALRHFPDDAGLSLDDAGWVAFDSLVEAVGSRYPWADAEHVEAVVATDSKGRFERRDGRIRAAYGHSVDVELESTTTSVPDCLYHGTSPRNLDAILDDGVKPMGRQAVHLSETREEARNVGSRHADDPVVLSVDARSMREDGFEIDKRGAGTYTVRRVPPSYLEVAER